MFGPSRQRLRGRNCTVKDADLSGKLQCYHFSVSRAGYVLTGGRSSRMGREKALLPLSGGTLGEKVARAVQGAAGSAVLVGNPDLAGTIGFPGIPDLYPGEGPLGGILTALRHTSADWNLITACDMPELTHEFLSTLLAEAARTGAAVLMPCPQGGLPEPLCAVYHHSARGPAEAAFSNGIRKITSAFDGLNVVHLAVPEVKWFQNVNTPGDWAGYAAG